ncbi:MAG: Do family serine endopeptidase [Roseitalea porphyridii]
MMTRSGMLSTRRGRRLSLLLAGVLLGAVVSLGTVWLTYPLLAQEEAAPHDSAPSDSLAERQVPADRQQIQLSFAPLVREVAPSVVNIYAERTVMARERSPLFNDPFFQRFFGDRFGDPFGGQFGGIGPLREQRQTSLGSGVILRDGGLVVTNHHVIAGAQGVRVVLADRSEYDAEVLVSDEHTDLALLQIQGLDGRRLDPVALADSDTLEAGDLVLALGYPFGVGQTVTSGIVSAQARTGVGISDFSFFIQTDAAINPGNSGGALVAMDGAVVGINTAIFSQDGGSVGIGFAIPANMVRSLLAGWDNGMPLARPWLGAQGQSVTAALADSLGLERPAGVVLSEIVPDGPAHRAGLRRGDVITAVGDQPVEDRDTLDFRIATAMLGETAVLTVQRGAETLSLDLPIEAPPEEPAPDLTLIEGVNPFAGAEVANLSPAFAIRNGLAQGPFEGVIVASVADRSPADRVGVEPGDILVAINGRAIAGVADVVAATAEPAPVWEITLNRGGRTIDATIRG